jgi:hypothetical protein
MLRTITIRPSKHTSLKKLQARCDAVVGRQCRSLGRCEFCGSIRPPFHWSHMITRGNHKLRYDSRNYSCLCLNCHKYADTHPDWKAERFDRIRGKGTVEQLRIESRHVEPIRESFYLEVLTAIGRGESTGSNIISSRAPSPPDLF